MFNLIPLLLAPAATLAEVKVPVQLGVMSRCPDALLCEDVFDDVYSRTADKMDFSLTYIAKVATDTNATFPDVACMHGPEECAGNIQQLCVAHHAPRANWWQFVQCQNSQGRWHIGEPDVAVKCAVAAGIDWEASGAAVCALPGDEAQGMLLLRDSARLTSKLGIRKSCTVMIDDEAVCVHDGDWKDCEAGHTTNDFVRQIEAAYERLNAPTLRAQM